MAQIALACAAWMLASGQGSGGSAPSSSKALFIASSLLSPEYGYPRGPWKIWEEVLKKGNLVGGVLIISIIFVSGSISGPPMLLEISIWGVVTNKS